MKEEIIIIGYSGHAYVVCDILEQAGAVVYGYGDSTEKALNPFNLVYIGNEREDAVLAAHFNYAYFVSIGENKIRRRVFENLQAKGLHFCNAFHPSASIASKVVTGTATMLGAGVKISPLVRIGTGVILNTGCIVEHECSIGDFVHIAPGTVLCGNVSVGENTFIGANSVVKQDIKIGKDCIIGAGSVVIKDVPDHSIIAGNPAKSIKK